MSENELIDKQNLKIEYSSDKKDAKEGELEIPEYKERIDLTEDQIVRLRSEVFEHFEILDAQRNSIEHDKKCEELEAQYDGEMSDDTDQEFSLNIPVTKVKVDSIVTMASKSFIESDPKFSVSARPETIREGREDVAEKQADYLDYLFDEEIAIAVPLRQALHQAANLFVGFLKASYDYKVRRRKHEESYSGKPEKDEKTGQVTIPGLQAFLQKYPTAAEEGDENFKYVKALASGKDIDIVVDYDEVVYNNPRFTFLDSRDFWAPIDCEGYEGLCDTQITIERQRYSYWELKKKEHASELINVDEILDSKDGKINAESKKKQFEIYEIVYWFNMGKSSSQKNDSTDNPDDDMKIVCWFEKEKKAFLGAIYYPYHQVDCYYIPFHIKSNKPGLYKGGIAEDLTSSNLAQNALLNFMLTGEWIKNTITPIVREGSTIAQQFLENRWTHGLPLFVPAQAESLNSDMTFLEKTNSDSSEIINTLLFLAKVDDDVSHISSLNSGRDLPTDPTAPASKVALLLKQSGINMEDYINCLLPSFNLIGEITLKLIYQMSRAGRMYKQRQTASQVVGQLSTGANIFDEIKPDELIAKSIISSRAAGFAFDKIQEKNENLSIYQLLRADPAFIANPSGVNEMIRTLLKSWSPMWKAKVDQIAPTPAQFKNKELETTVAALDVYFKQLQQQTQVTGVEQPPELGQFMALAQQMKQAITTPQPEENK